MLLVSGDLQNTRGFSLESLETLVGAPAVCQQSRNL